MVSQKSTESHFVGISSKNKDLSYLQGRLSAEKNMFRINMGLVILPRRRHQTVGVRYDR